MTSKYTSTFFVELVYEKVDNGSARKEKVMLRISFCRNGEPKNLQMHPPNKYFNVGWYAIRGIIDMIAGRTHAFLLFRFPESNQALGN